METNKTIRAMNNDILEKGKSMPIGTIHNGFKKIAEGKWRKVSNEGKTKEEYLDNANKHLDIMYDAQISNNDSKLRSHDKLYSDNKEAASKLDSKEYSDQEVLGEKEKLGEVFRLKNDKDMPFSLHSLKNKDLKSLGTKEVNFASGKQTYHIFENDGEKIEVPERFLDKKSKNKEVEKALTTLEIGYLNGEVDRDTIEKARKMALGTRVTHKDGVTREKTANGWRPVKKEESKKEKDLILLSKEKEMDERHNKELKEHYNKTKAHWDKYNSIAKKGYHTPEELKEHNKGTEKLGKEYNELMERHFQEKHGLVKEMMDSKKNSQILGHTKSGKPMMKTQNLENGKIYKSSKNENNTYRFSSKIRKNEYSFAQFENGVYVDMVVLNEEQIAYLYE